MESNSKKNQKLKVLFDNYIEENKIPSLNESEYEKQFKSFKKLKSKNLPYIFNISHLCHQANISSKQINFLLSNKEKGYVRFKIPKKNGQLREICAPSKPIKSLQRWVLDNILYKLNCGPSAHGFVPNRTIVTNAQVHVNQDLVLGIDIKDFFPSINFGSVYHIFKSKGYTKKMAWNLTNLCTYDGKLPQGAPTSPMLANLVAMRLDNKIVNYCRRRNFNYSRYADDITISGSDKLPMHKEKIIAIVEDFGFTVNSEKTRMFSKGSKQKVTGLIVNDKVSLGRKKKQHLKAIVHNIVKNGPVVENRSEEPFFREKIFGHLGHAKSIDPDFAVPLIEALKSVDWEDYDEKIEDLRKGELLVRSFEKKSSIEPVDTTQKIKSENDLLKIVCNSIKELKDVLESRREIQAYWNESRKVTIEGKEYIIPAEPKREVDIQPTLARLFIHRLNPLGIQTVRESDEGIGTVDFRFLITTEERIPLNTCAELKLAHHDRLEHGLTKQLPSYIAAIPSKSGIFLVMWFKDENGKYFNEPLSKTKLDMIEYLEETVKIINEKKGFNIEPILIDASKRPSASQS